MWVNRPDYDRLWARVEGLEASLRDSVPGDVYRASLARIAELERRNDWAMDMLLRRSGTFPVPPVKAEGPQPEAQPPVPTDTAIAQAEAIIAAGNAANASREEIENAVTAQTGITGQDLAALMSGRVM